MNIEKLKNIIEIGENDKIEFKPSFSGKVIIALTAFANYLGGRVLVGIEDSGNIAGLKEIGPETIQNFINQIKISTYPQLIPNVDIVKMNNNSDVIVFTIAEYPIKPIYYKNRYFKRVKNSNHVLSIEEIVNLQQQSLDISFDSYKSDISYEDANVKIIEKFISNLKQKERILVEKDNYSTLKKLKLLKEENKKLSIAGKILFTESEYYIHIGRFKGKDTIIDDYLIQKPLFEAVEEVLLFIKKHINLSFEFSEDKLQRKEVWQYPIKVIRELLLNCVIHRDYKSPSDIVIKIFDDRIVFSNPGNLYGGLTIDNLKSDDYYSALRNKTIAQMFYLIGDIEKYGTGYIRMRNILQNHKDISLEFEEKGYFFISTIAKIKADPLTTLETTLETGYSNLKTKDGIIYLLKENGSYTIPDIMQKLQKSRATIKEHLAKLKKDAIIKRVGSKKSGYWEVIKKQ